MNLPLMPNNWYPGNTYHVNYKPFLSFSTEALFDLAVLKKKVREKEERKKKKLKVIKSEVEDLSESFGNPEGIPPMSQDPSPVPLSSVKEE